MFPYNLQHLEILLNCVKSPISTKSFYNIFKSIKYFLHSRIFQEVEILMLRCNILQYLRKMLRHYFNYNETLEIFLTCFCNIMCCVGLYRCIVLG